MVLYLSDPMAQKIKFESQDWDSSELYLFLEATKELPLSMSQPMRVGTVTRAKVDTNHETNTIDKRL